MTGDGIFYKKLFSQQILHIKEARRAVKITGRGDNPCYGIGLYLSPEWATEHSAALSELVYYRRHKAGVITPACSLWPILGQWIIINYSNDYPRATTDAPAGHDRDSQPIHWLVL